MKKKSQRTETTCSTHERFGFVSQALAVFVLSVQLLLPVAPVFADEILSSDSSSETSQSSADTSSPDTAPKSAPENTEEKEIVEPVSSDSVDMQNVETTVEQETEEDTISPNPTTLTPEQTLEEETVTPETETPSVEQESTNDEVEIPVVVEPQEEESNPPVEETPSGESENTNEEVEVPVQTPVTGTSSPQTEEPTNEEETSEPTTTPSDTESNGEPEPLTPDDTEPEPTPVEEVHTVVNDENRLSFGIDDCAQVADGSFYCSKGNEETTAPLHSDRLFAGPDTDGDNEIFLERNGELTQLTHNTTDDGAPYYDNTTNTAVWHRLINARYQIVSYDFDTERETVLTNDHYNNMQPTRAAGITAWQGWIGSDWDILIHDSEEVIMLTDNQVHDLGPRVTDGYVLWQAEEAEGWKVRVYDTISGKIETIADTEGASIENPRFVLIYDAKQENGDVETRGYDLKSQKTISLNVEPHDLPEELPDPDQTGEDRALISGNAQLKTKTEDESEPEPDPVVLPPPATSTSTDDLVVPPLSTEHAGTSPVEASPIEDLIVEPLPEPQFEQPVADLVVPVYVPEEHKDPQDTVATST